MKRELNVLARLIATLSTALFALVAIRRVLIDLQDILGIKVRIEKTKKPLAKEERQSLLLKELTSAPQSNGLKLGTVNEDKFKGKAATLSQNARDLNPHTLIFGASRSGKTAYTASLIKQDIQNNDRAVIVLDSDGDLVNALIEWMASDKNGEKFAARTKLLEPTNPDCNLGLNPMIAEPDRSPSSLASAVVRAFEAADAVNGTHARFNAQSANILRNSVMLLIANNKPITDLESLLSDNDVRDTLLESVTKRKNESPDYPLLLETWGQYKKLARTDQWIVWVEPIMTRLGAARAEQGLMKVMTSTSNNIDLKDVIAQKGILLLKLNSRVDPKLLCGLLFSGLMDAALLCGAKSDNMKTALYIDLLDAVMTQSSFQAITEETSKNRIDVTGTIRSLHALPADFRDLLMATAGRSLSLVVSQQDANLLSGLFFKDENKTSTDQEKNKPTCDDRLQSQHAYEFYFHAARAVGAVKIQAPEFTPVERAKINQELMQQIIRNEKKVSTTST